MRLNRDPKRWGVPLSALLGALYAQIGLGLGAIGGKDSMSGTFEHIDVPPTLISFALAPAKASELITNVLTERGKKLYWIPMHKDFSKIPDFKELADMYREIHKNILSKNIRFATVVENGGIASAIVKSCSETGSDSSLKGMPTACSPSITARSSCLWKIPKACIVPRSALVKRRKKTLSTTRKKCLWKRL